MTEIFRALLRPTAATLAIGTAAVAAMVLSAQTTEAVPFRCDSFNDDGQSPHRPRPSLGPLPFTGCDPGEFCVYEKDNGCGRHLHMGVAHKNFASRRLEGGALNDNVSSVFNNSNKDWCIYEHADTRKDRGESLRIHPGEKRSIAGDRGSSNSHFRWNDKASGANPC